MDGLNYHNPDYFSFNMNYVIICQYKKTGGEIHIRYIYLNFKSGVQPAKEQ